MDYLKHGLITFSKRKYSSQPKGKGSERQKSLRQKSKKEHRKSKI